MSGTGLVLGMLLLLAACAAAQGAEAEGELVANARFGEAGEGALPARWALWAPLWEKARAAVRRVPEGLLVEATEEPFAVGGVSQDVKDVKGGQAYAVEAACELRKIASPLRSVMVRLGWTKKGQLIHPAGWLVRGPIVDGVDGVDGKFHDVLVAPAEADGATLSLEVKWPQGGSVLWKRVSMRPTDPPKPRKVKVGTVHFRPKDSTPERNLELYCEKIDAAGKLGLDIVCLPEAITMVGTARSCADVAEPIPGPSTQRLGEAARRNRLWVVAGLMERDGSRLYNTAVLLDRQGKLAGKYRKIHLPREEWNKGVTPGHEYPVFRTDFGIVAIQICYDWFFPEAAEAFALAGAEILFAPTWGTTFADKEGRIEGENVFRTRARDNGLYLVPSVFDGSSMVIDPLGRIVASNRGQEGVFWAEIDLSVREPLEWVGHWRDIGPRDRMPETYRSLAE